MAKSKALIAAEAKIAELETANAELVEEGEAAANDMVVLVEEKVELNKVIERSKEEVQAAEERLTASIAEMKVPELTENGVEGVAGIWIGTPDEYREKCKREGTIMGRRPNQKTECTIEELRALINSNWTPSMVMEKHGIDAEEIKQLVWKLSKKELRDNPIKFSIERDFFGKEG